MSTIERAIQKLGQTAPDSQDASTRDDIPSSLTALEPNPALLMDEPAALPEFAMNPPNDTDRDNDESASRIQMDYDYMASLGMVTPDSERNQVAEEYRHIKRPLLLNAFGEGALSNTNRNLIMVCSARPNEGKTFTAINLALSIALERDRTVLLVDADVAKPSLARVLNFPVTAGLVDFLADPHRRLADLILQTNMPKLRILPAGRRHSHSTELLASDGMQILAQELADRYPDRVVIFDSPPLLATSEAAVLAGLVGQVVMVVEAEKTKREELKEALGLLKQDQYVGLVLNKSNRPFGADYYYGSYGSYGE